jgi:hypothetical protein
MRTVWIVLLLLAASQEAPPDDRQRWLPPVRTVTLSGPARNLGRVLAAIRDQSKLSVDAYGVEEKTSVQVDWTEVPVLQALADLCQKLGTGLVKVREDQKDLPTLELDSRSPLPAALFTWRQFQVAVTEFTVTVQKSLEATKRSAQITLQVTLQPGTHPLSVGSFEPLEIIDDQGWSLLKARDPAEGSRELTVGEDPDSVIFANHVRPDEGREAMAVELAAPAPEARVIERFRGKIAFTFPMGLSEASLAPQELVPGKEIRIGALTLRVVRFEQKGIKVFFEYRMSRRGGGRDYDSFPDFELVDDKGDRLNHGSSGSGSPEGFKMEYTLGRPVPLHAVKYRAYIGRYTLMVPVDLRQIPIPRKRP